MTGTPRRTGCDTCRIRKKKCGEEHPECKACVTARFRCPGYVKNWKFVPQNEYMTSLYKKKRHIFEERSDVSTVILESLNSGVHAGFDLYEKYYGFENSFRVGIFNIQMSEYERTSYVLAHMLEDRTANAAFPLFTQGAFYRCIPRRLGRNLALDAAVSCLCRIWMDTMTNSSPSSATAALYVRSLSALRACLDDVHIRYESETICASIILQLCELALNADYGCWNNLTKGTKMLIQNCGPSRFTKSFERSMLDSQRAIFICHDIKDGQQCFLSQLEWRQIFSHMPTSPPGRASFALRSAACDFFVDVPELLSKGTKLRNYNSKDSEHLLDFLTRAINMRDSMETWYYGKLLPLVSSGPVMAEESIFQNESKEVKYTPQHRYDDILLAVLDCISNSLLISLHQMITSLMPDSLKIYKDRRNLSPFLMTVVDSLTVSQAALSYVRNHSRLASKPLEFSLNQIWSYTNVISKLPS